MGRDQNAQSSNSLLSAFLASFVFRTMAPETKKWKESNARAILKNDIIADVIPEHMTSRQVWNSREIYQEYPFAQFSTNLGTLRRACQKNKKRMEEDADFYGHDRAILDAMQRVSLENEATHRSIPWHRSPAKNLLKNDIKENKHLEMPPSQLRETREEYMAFSKRIFRDRIRQEVNSDHKKKWRIQKKQLRAGKKVDMMEES